MGDGFDAGGVTGGDGLLDDERMAELRALAARHDPVPAEVVAAARSAIAWLALDNDLAELTADSSVEPALAGARGADTPTLLTFIGPGLTVEVEVLAQAGNRRLLLGQIVPPAPGTIEARHRDGTVSVVIDKAGRFALDDVAAGPVSLRCCVHDRVVETAWVLA